MQAKACSLDVDGVLPPEKRREQMFPVLFGYTNTFILYTDLRSFFSYTATDINLLSRAGKLDGVGKEVDHDISYELLISFNKICALVQVLYFLVVFQQALYFFNGILYQFMEVHQVEKSTHLA